MKKKLLSLCLIGLVNGDLFCFPPSKEDLVVPMGTLALTSLGVTITYGVRALRKLRRKLNSLQEALAEANTDRENQATALADLVQQNNKFKQALEVKKIHQRTQTQDYNTQLKMGIRDPLIESTQRFKWEFDDSFDPCQLDPEKRVRNQTGNVSRDEAQEGPSDQVGALENEQ